LDVAHRESPGEIASKAEVEREGVLSVGRYGCTVGCEEIVAGALLTPWEVPSGKYAEVGTGVDQESQFAASFGDEQAAGSYETGVCRHQRLSLPFPCGWKEHCGVHLRALSPNRRWYWH